MTLAESELPRPDAPPEDHESEISESGPRVEFNSIDPRQIPIGRITGFVVAVLMFAASIVGVFVAWAATDGFGSVFFIALTAAVLFSGFMFWLAYIWPVWEFRCTAWHLGEQGLEIHRGVFWKHRISIPVARVQHADVSQGPLQRRFQLGKLTVHTAGTQNASVELDGLSHDLAIELRDKIVSQRKSIDVV